MTISSVSYADLEEVDADFRVARRASEDRAIVITFEAFDCIR
jgi:hypothetical protein